LVFVFLIQIKNLLKDLSLTKINFLDLPKNNIYDVQNKTSKPFIPLVDSEIFPSNSIKNNNYSNINKLHINLLNSLNYQSEINAFPSTLPEEINIKFTQLTLLDKIFGSKEVAQANIANNTIYMSTEFLSTPKDPFLKEFSEKFTDKQSLIDAIFYHEFAHIISTNHFPQISNLNNQLKNLYPEINNSEFKNAPLYQIIRNVEENFSDAYASLLHKEKHNAFDIYHYVSSRNSTNSGKSKNYDFNINSLGPSFNQISNINLTSESIDDICKKLYSFSIKSSLEILEKTISNNTEFKNNLEKNLIMLNQNNNNPIHSIELLLTQQNNQLILPNQNSIINKMMNIRNHSINSDTKDFKLKQ
jgi:hypothetical protein